MRFEAKHQYFKQLKKLMNFKNICLSLSRHHQKAAAMNRSRNSIFKENENGPARLPQGEELLRMKERVSSAFAIHISSINSVEAFKWIKIHGTKYVEDECYLAMKFDDEDQLQFGLLRYQPGLKKCEFWKFLISRCSDKAFQELSFKKKLHKKIFFQCKVIGH